MKKYEHFPTVGEIPADRPVLETNTSYVWMTEEKIYFSVPKTGAPLQPTDKQLKDDIHKLKAFVGDQKVCLVIQSGAPRPLPSGNQRELIQKELNTLVRALALITPSTLSRMTANIFFALKPAAYPVKMFTDVDEAVAWLKSVCLKAA